MDIDVEPGDEPAGPLSGLRVLEVGGIGPLPFAGMMLGEMGAEVVRIDRPRPEPLYAADPSADLLNRGKRSVMLDLKRQDARHVLLELVRTSDVLIEGFRPGTAERLGFGPDVCRGIRPDLVYGRMTGWGQTGPLAGRAGHDLNYIGVSGALAGIGEAGGAPQIPLNLVGDFGGGALYLVAGVLAALVDASRTGRGRTVDASIVDGTSHLMLSALALGQVGWWSTSRGMNLLDGGAPFYRVYPTSDGGHMTVAAIEAQFFAELIDALELPFDPARQYDRARWPELERLLRAAFASRTQAEWSERFAGSDACVWPVLDAERASRHPHLQDRRTYAVAEDRLQPSPAPRFDGATPRVPPAFAPGRDTVAVLSSAGLDAEALIASGAAFEKYALDN